MTAGYKTERSATHANRGMPFEKLIKLSAEAQADLGLDLAKRGQGFQATGRTSDGQIIGRATTSGPLDFLGGYARAGRWDVRVECEAKSTKVATRFPLDMLEKRQIARLERLHQRRAIAFVLIEFRGPEPAYRAMTWPVLQPYWTEWQLRDMRKVPASIPRATIDRHCLHVPTYKRGGALRLDLVAVVQHLMAARTGQ